VLRHQTVGLELAFGWQDWLSVVGLLSICSNGYEKVLPYSFFNGPWALLLVKAFLASEHSPLSYCHMSFF